MWRLLCLAAMSAVTPLCALTAELEKDGVGRVLKASVETQHYRLTIDGSRGARVMSLTDKALGQDIVRADDSGLGGLFEDRPHFANLLYLGDVVEQTGQRLVVRFGVTHTDGLKLAKTYEFREEQPWFRVSYAIENPTQLPFRLWVRNFATPGGGDLTEADHAYLHQQGTLQDLAVPGGYYPALTGPWMAYLDTEKRSGFFVRCDFDLLEQFYFWSQSRVTPTFEWIYRAVPAGQKTSTSLLFGLISGLGRVGNVTPEGIPTEAEPAAVERPSAPQFAAIAGWKPLEELYEPDRTELFRGFLLITSGVSAPAPRLRALETDLGLQETDAVPLELFGLAESSTVRATVRGLPASAVRLQVETDGWLADGTEATVERGKSRRLWLKLSSADLGPGEYAGEMELSSGKGPALTVPIAVKVWNARLPERPLIGTQWYAFVPTLSSYDLDEVARKRFIVYLDNLRQLRCDNLDWAVVPHQTVPHLRVRGSGETLAEWGQAHPDATVEQLPDLNWSYYDLWFEEPVKRGMTRFVAHVPSGNNWREAAVINAVFPGREVDPNSEEGWAVMLWYYRQLREYATAKGFQSFWAKLDDEIPAEHIPTWLAAARRYKAAGYRPFTTNTGGICRSERLLNEMNQESEAWQVALCLSRDFRDLTTKAAVYEPRRETLEVEWGPYTNGGAEKTWCVREPLLVGERNYEQLDEVEIRANGQALEFRGGSPWGNQEDGVFFLLGPHVYLRLPDGSDPNQAEIEISYRRRTLQPSDTPAVALEPTDEVWYYGGGKYSQPYEAARAYPWRAVAWKMRGYGYWTYLWWNGEDILVKLDPATNALTLSAAWEGLRDGNEDADYFLLAQEALRVRRDPAGLARLRAVFGEDDGAVLPMGEQRSEIYAWDDFVQPTYARYNAAKRLALRVLAVSQR